MNPLELLKNPNFLKWFGKSVVKDELGNPVRVFHGTNKDFDEFSKTLDIGFHFGTPEQASYKASGGVGGNVIPAYLKLKNPITLKDHVWDTPDTLKDGLKHLDTEGTLSKHVDEYNILQETFKKEMKRLENISSTTANQDYRLARSKWLTTLGNKKNEIDKQAQQVIKNSGYDGVVYDNAVEGSGKSYIAFDPNQIKSTFNRGTFDPIDHNILRSIMGASALGATLAPQQAQAENWRNYQNKEPALQEPIIDPTTLLAGPARWGGGLANLVANTGLNAIMGKLR